MTYLDNLKKHNKNGTQIVGFVKEAEKQFEERYAENPYNERRAWITLDNGYVVQILDANIKDNPDNRLLTVGLYHTEKYDDDERIAEYTAVCPKAPPTYEDGYSPKREALFRLIKSAMDVYNTTNESGG